MPIIQNLSEVLAKRGVRMVVYGDSGTGKSVRAATAIRWGAVEIHDFDEQTGNLQRFLAESQKLPVEELAKIRAVSYQGMTVDNKVNFFLNRLGELAALKTAGKAPDIATLVVDSYTTFEHLFFNYLFERYTPNATGFGAARQTIEVGKEELTLPGSMDYSVLSRALKIKVFDVLKNLGVNVILNCHEKDFLESKGVVIKQGGPLASGQIRDLMPTEFLEVHRMFFKQGHRVQVKPTDHYIAKTALPNVPTHGILSETSLKVFDGIAYQLSSEISLDKAQKKE